MPIFLFSPIKYFIIIIYEKKDYQSSRF